MAERKVAIPSFEVLRRGRLVKAIPVHRNRLIIGSEDGADIRLKHPAIAPRHLEVVVVDGRYLEAANLAGEGRVLLGQRPMDRARLRDGDELDLGPVTLRLTYSHTDSRPSLKSVSGPLQNPDVEATDPIGRGTPPATESLSEREPMQGPASALSIADTTGKHRAGLGKRKASPPSDRRVQLPEGLDVELEETVLDPVPVAVIEPPGGRAQRVPLRVGSFVVGAGRCAFRLSYPGVAPAHVELMVMPDGAAYIKHLAGAGKKTLLNGAPVQFSRWSAGDRLQVGPVSISLASQPRTGEELAEEPTILGPPPTPATTSSATTPPAALVQDSSANTAGGLRYVHERPDHDDAGIGPDPFGGMPPAAAPAIDSSAPPPASAEVSPAEAEAEESSVNRAPTPIPSPPDVPTPGPLVVARGTKPKKSRTTRKPLTTPSPLVTTNTVEVRLGISAEDTYSQLYTDDMLAYRPSPWKRVAPVLLMVGLLALVGGLGWREFGPGSAATTATSSGPVTATGTSGLRGEEQDTYDGSGKIVIGDPRAPTKRRSTGGGSRPRTSADSGDVDWDEPGTRTYATGPVGSYYDDLANAPVKEAPAEGRMETEEVERLLYSNQKRFKSCYEEITATDASAEGVVWLSMTLDTTGRLGNVSLEPRSTLNSDALTRCLTRRLSSVKLPPATGSAVTFSYKFEFRQ